MTIPIPARLLAEVAASPERFMPDAPPRLPSEPNPDKPKWTAINLIEFTYRGGQLPNLVPMTCEVGELVYSNRLPWGYIKACALVGSSSDPSSPRPDAGDRVLAIKVPGVSGAAGRIGVVIDREVYPRIAVDFGDEIAMDGDELPADTWWSVAEWAILPAELERHQIRVEKIGEQPRTVSGEYARPSRWSVGRDHGRNLLVDDELIGTVDTAELAALIVEAMTDPGREIERLNTLLAEAREWPGQVGQTVRTDGEGRASVEELSAVLVSEFGGHKPSETSVHAAIRLLREQRTVMDQVREGAERERRRANEAAQELAAVRQLLTIARADATRDREIALQLTPLVGEFKPEDGPEALMAEAAIDIAVLEKLQALVGDTDG